MKNIILIFTISLLSLISCDNININDNGNDKKKTTMTITNLNFSGCIEVSYASVNFGCYGNTSKVTKDVLPGTYNIFITSHVFYDDNDIRDFFAGSNMQNHNVSCICPVFRTNTVTSEDGQNNQFNITRNTVATFISGYGYNGAVEITGPIQDIANDITNNYYELLRNLTNIDIHNKSDYDILSIKLFDVIRGIITSGESGYLMFDTNDFKDTDTGEISFYLHILNERLYCKFSNISIKRNKTNNEFTFNNDTIITAIDNNITDTLKNIVDVMTIEYSKPQIEITHYYNKIKNNDDTNLEETLVHNDDYLEFYIKNIGINNLILEEINSNYVNISENTSGYFSLYSQPDNSVIASGKTVVFIVQFNPLLTGNYSAKLQIKSNSRNDDNFIFRIIENSINR